MIHAGWFHTYRFQTRKKETDNNNKLYTLESARKAPNRIDEMHALRSTENFTALGEDQKPSSENFKSSTIFTAIFFHSWSSTYICPNISQPLDTYDGNISNIDNLEAKRDS